MNPLSGPFVDTQKNSGKYGDDFFYDDVNKLVKMDENALINDLDTTSSRDVQALILERLCFVNSLDKYPFLMERILKFDPYNYKSLYALLSGSLMGAPNDKKYDIYLQNKVITDMKKELRDRYTYEDAILILGMRKTIENHSTLKDISKEVNVNENLDGEMIKDALEFYNLQPAKVDIGKMKNIDIDELKIIKEIFSKGLPGNMCDPNNLIIEDGKLKGFWKKTYNQWIFYQSGIKDKNVPYLTYNFAFTPQRNRAFVKLTIWKGNMNWKAFIYRLDKIKGLFTITGLWFVAIG